VIYCMLMSFVFCCWRRSGQVELGQETGGPRITRSPCTGATLDEAYPSLDSCLIGTASSNRATWVFFSFGGSHGEGWLVVSSKNEVSVHPFLAPHTSLSHPLSILASSNAGPPTGSPRAPPPMNPARTRGKAYLGKAAIRVSKGMGSVTAPFLGGSPPTLLPLRDGHNPVPRGFILPIPHPPPHWCASRIPSTTRSSGPGRGV